MKEKTDMETSQAETVHSPKDATSEAKPAIKKAPRNPKILFIITKSNFGGAQRYVFELATRLAKEGQTVAVALGGNGILKSKLEDAGILVFPIDSAQRDISITKEIKVLFRLFSIIRAYKPTIVHLNSPKIGGLGAVAARTASFFNFFGRKDQDGRRMTVEKIIYTNHGWPFNEPRPAWQQLIIRGFSWLTVFLGDITIVLSRTERDDARKWPFVQKKFVIIPNGVAAFTPREHADALASLIGETRARQWTEEGRTIVGTISELHRNKGLTFAIEGIRSYIEQYPQKPVGFIIIGEGEQRKELEGIIFNNNKSGPNENEPVDLSNSVILAGHVNEAREYLKAFDLFLLSSVKEGLPFAILEAGYAGVPVISTSVGGIPEVIKNLENGMLIAPRRPQEIKNALVYLDEHPEAKETMIKDFKEKIDHTYNFEVVYEEIREKLYQI